MIVAPWWVRWLVGASGTAVTLTAIAVLLLPNMFAAIGWLRGLVAVAVFSLAVAGPVVVIQNPVRQSYAAALTGLNPEQRTRVTKALRRGEVPADPRVLVAAIRMGTLSQAYLRRATSWQKSAKWWMPALYIVLAVLNFTTHTPRQGLLWLGFGVYFGVYFAWASYRAQRLLKHVERLRVVATEIPEAASAAADTADSVTLPPRRIWAAMLLAVVFAIIFGIAAYVWGLSDRRTPDCRTADQAVDFIYVHQDMLDARQITPDGPLLSRYQVWSDQLQTYARQVSAPDISRHLHRIAELSMQAVTLVQDIRKEAVVSPSPDVIRDHENAYQKAMTELVAEEGDLNPICHPGN